MKNHALISIAKTIMKKAYYATENSYAKICFWCMRMCNEKNYTCRLLQNRIAVRQIQRVFAIKHSRKSHKFWKNINHTQKWEHVRIIGVFFWIIPFSRRPESFSLLSDVIPQPPRGWWPLERNWLFYLGNHLGSTCVTRFCLRKTTIPGWVTSDLKNIANMSNLFYARV